MKEIVESVRDSKGKFDFKGEEAGAKLSHNRITRNLGGLLWQHLRGKNCESFTSDMAVKVKTANGNYSYPDVVVTCDGNIFSETSDKKSQAENPVLIIEVLSANSLGDLDKKFEEYKELHSLIEYVVIFQDLVKIRYHIKSVGGKWRYCEKEGEDVLLFLRSVGLVIRLKEIYEKVTY